MIICNDSRGVSMNKLSKERILLSVLLLFIGLLISVPVVNKYIHLHNYLELLVYLITPLGIIATALFLAFNCSIKTFLKIVSIATLTSSLGLILISYFVYTSASELQSSPDTALPGLNALGAIFMYLAVMINIGIAILSLIAGGLGIGIANGRHWCTGTAVYSFILILLALITVPDTIGHVFQLLISTSTVIYYKSSQSLQSSTEDIISSKNDETDDKIEIN